MCQIMRIWLKVSDNCVLSILMMDELFDFILINTIDQYK